MRFLKKMLLPLAALALLVGCSEKEDVKSGMLTVSFDTDGGTPVPEAVTVEKGKTIAEPSVTPRRVHILRMVHLYRTEVQFQVHSRDKGYNARRALVGRS